MNDDGYQSPSTAAPLTEREEQIAGLLDAIGAVSGAGAARGDAGGVMSDIATWVSSGGIVWDASEWGEPLMPDEPVEHDYCPGHVMIDAWTDDLDLRAGLQPLLALEASLIQEALAAAQAAERLAWEAYEAADVRWPGAFEEARAVWVAALDRLDEMRRINEESVIWPTMISDRSSKKPMCIG